MKKMIDVIVKTTNGNTVSMTFSEDVLRVIMRAVDDRKRVRVGFDIDSIAVNPRQEVNAA